MNGGGSSCVNLDLAEKVLAWSSVMSGDHKDCFGILDRVFPPGEGGLREVPSLCRVCPDKKECLQEALATREGLELRRQVLDRAAPRGLIGWLRRWSERKELSRRIKKMESGKR